MKTYTFSFSVPLDPQKPFSFVFDEKGKPKLEEVVIEVEAENKLSARKKAEAQFKERYPDESLCCR